MRSSDTFLPRVHELTVLAEGIILISGLISPSSADIKCVIDEISLSADSKTIAVLENGDALNLGSFTLSKDSITSSPSRFTDLFGEVSGRKPTKQFINFIQKCEQAQYEAVVLYSALYPEIVRSLWWRPHGHIARYLPGQHIGFHADTDVEHQWGTIPLNQTPINNVISINLYITGSGLSSDYGHSFSGGDIIWKNARCRHSPMSGDILIYPSNFMGTHAVSPVVSGQRIAYLSVAGYGVDQLSGEFIGQGVDHWNPNPETTMGRTWMPLLGEHVAMVVSGRY